MGKEDTKMAFQLISSSRTRANNRRQFSSSPSASDSLELRKSHCTLSNERLTFGVRTISFNKEIYVLVDVWRWQGLAHENPMSRRNISNIPNKSNMRHNLTLSEFLGVPGKHVDVMIDKNVWIFVCSWILFLLIFIKISTSQHSTAVSVWVVSCLDSQAKDIPSNNWQGIELTQISFITCNYTCAWILTLTHEYILLNNLISLMKITIFYVLNNFIIMIM